MPKANPQITNFTTGELSPLARGRIDTQKYNNGAEEILNGIVRPQGGVVRRPGARYLGEMADNDKVHRIIPFEFSSTQPYVIELGDNTLRIWKDDELVLGYGPTDLVHPPGSGGYALVSAIADNGSGKYRLTLLSDVNIQNGDKVVISEVEGSGNIEDINASWEAEVTFVGVRTIDIDTGTPPSGTMTTGTVGFISKVPLNLATPWGSSKVNDVQFAQSADILWMVHPDYPPQVLKRWSANRWTLSRYEFKDGPYLGSNLNSVRYVCRKISHSTSADTIVATTIPHNFSTGDVVDILNNDPIYGISGKYRITVVDADHFTLDNSYAVATGNYYGGEVDADVKLTMSTVTDTATLICDQTVFSGVGTHDDEYVEVKWNGRWVLFKITDDNISTTEVVADFVENGLYDLDPNVTFKSRVNKRDKAEHASGAVHPEVSIEFDTLVLTANFSGVFSREDKGKFVRFTQKGTGEDGAKPTVGETSANWGLIAKVNSNTAANATKVTVTAIAGTPVDWDGSATSDEFHVNNRILSATVTSNHALFASTDIGRWIRLKYRGVWVRGTILTYTSSTVVTVKIDWEFNEIPQESDDPDTIANFGIADQFRLGSWSDTTGYPLTVAFHEQRLVFAGSAWEPQSVWMSISGDFPNFQITEPDGTVTDDMAVVFAFASTEVNTITWIQPGNVLLIGTLGGEWQVRSATSTVEAVTPTNIVVSQQTSFGAKSGIRGLWIGPGVLFVQRSGRKIYDLTYSFELDSWQGSDLTIVSDHIIRDAGKASRLAYQRQPGQVIWVLCSDGTLAGLTFYRDQQIAAWHRHQISGGTVESITVIPNSTGTEDSLYMVVKRTINAVTKRYLEKLDPDFHPTSSTDKGDQFYVDSGLTINQASSTAVAGLGHLEGELVSILSDGVNIETKTVSSGAITLSTAAAKIQVGLAYTTRVVTLPKEGGSPMGTSMGKTHRVYRAGFRVWRTPRLRVGRDSSNTELQEFESGNLATGDFRVTLNNRFRLDETITVEQTDPVGMFLLAIWPQQEVNE